MDELRLTLVTDRTRARDLPAVVADCVAAGLPAVHLREKDLGAGALALLGRALRRVAPRPGALLIVNDRADVALAVDADGVQRTSTSLPVADLRGIAGGRLRIGASVHSVAEAIAAEADGADWVTFGPIYDTPSKRAFGSPQGLRALERVAESIRIPVVAIGGITTERVEDVLAAGAAGVAVIAAILDAPAPADATRRLLEALARARVAPHSE